MSTMKILLFILLLSTISCNIYNEYYPDTIISSKKDTTDIKTFAKLNTGFNFKTINDIILFIATYIGYEKDSFNFWQSPELTWLLKKGDCEDIAILTIYLLYTELHLSAEMLIIQIDNHKKSHAIVIIGDYVIDHTLIIKSNIYFNQFDSVILHNTYSLIDIMRKLENQLI